MVCSPAQQSANQKNASRSTGPKTEAGKAHSRRNSLKHGLTGDGVVLPDEDSSAVQERFEAFEADLKPKNSVALFLVQRAAVLSIRLERCVRNESAEITLGMLQADDAEAVERSEELARLIASIGEDPFEVVRQLERSPEGIDWMIQSWQDLKADLLDRIIDRWSRKHQDRVDQLIGCKPEVNGTSRISALSCANLGNLRFLDDGDWPNLSPSERRQAARVELIGLIDGQIARLNQTREGLDHESIALGRAGAPARAIFDTSPAAILARKYEAAAERGFYRALKQVEEQNAAVEADPSSELAGLPTLSHDEVESSGELGSFFPGLKAEKTVPEETRPLALRGSKRPTTGLDPEKNTPDRASLSANRLVDSGVNALSR